MELLRGRAGTLIDQGNEQLRSKIEKKRIKG
jgi:hypothetical protein